MMSSLIHAATERSLTADEVDWINNNLPGLDAALGFSYDVVSPTTVQAHFDVADCHKQPFGLVNGGVFASAGESTGSLMAMIATGRSVVGMTNTTDFIRSVSSGTVMVEASPVHVGRTTQIIDVVMTHRGRVAARTRLRTIAVDGS